MRAEQREILLFVHQAQSHRHHLPPAGIVPAPGGGQVLSSSDGVMEFEPDDLSDLERTGYLARQPGTGRLLVSQRGQDLLNRHFDGGAEPLDELRRGWRAAGAEERRQFLREISEV
jgi:hypothetical protein